MTRIAYHRSTMLLTALTVFLITISSSGIGGAHAADAAIDMSEAAKERSREMGNNAWHGQLHRLANLMVDDQMIGDLLGPVLRHQYELPPMQVRLQLWSGDRRGRSVRVWGRLDDLHAVL